MVGAACGRPRARKARPYPGLCVGAGLCVGPFVRHVGNRRRAGAEARPYTITPTNTNLLYLSPPIHAAAAARRGHKSLRSSLPRYYSRCGGCATGDSFSVSGQTRFRLRRSLGSALRSGAIPLLRSPPRYKPHLQFKNFPL